MVQNRSKLISLFVGNMTNAVVHKILEKAPDNEMIMNKYAKEEIASLEIAKRYREKINPVNNPLPGKDAEYIKKRLITKVKAELELRISKGYENIDITKVESMVDKVLKEMKII